MNLLNLKTAAAMLSVAALTGTTTYLVKEREADKLRADYQSLQEGQHKLAKDQQDAASAIRLRDEQIEQLKKDTAELPRLRGELDNLNRLLAKLRMEQAQGKQLGKRTEDEILERKAVDQPSQIKPGTLITKDMLAFAGYETPEDAYQSVIWSMFKGHGHEIGMVDVQRQQAFEKQLQEMEPLYKGLQILARKNIDSDHVELLVRLLLDQDEKALPSFVNQPEISIQAMVRDAGMWRIKAGGNTFPSVSEWQNIGNIIRYAY